MTLLQRVHDLLVWGYGPPQIDRSDADGPATPTADDGYACPLCTNPLSAHETSPLSQGQGRQMQCPAAAAADPPPAPAA